MNKFTGLLLIAICCSAFVFNAVSVLVDVFLLFFVSIALVWSLDMS